MEDLWFASASEIARRITGRSVTAVEVAEAFLKHIAVHDRLLNSFLNVMTDQALDAAQRVDDALRAGRPPGPLAGVPVAVKDLIDIAGMPTTAGAHRRFHTMAHEDAPVVTRLRDAGAIIVGKTGLHEFAYGVTNANPHAGSVRNPWDRSRTPGGASGGDRARGRRAAHRYPATLLLGRTGSRGRGGMPAGRGHACRPGRRRSGRGDPARARCRSRRDPDPECGGGCIS